MMVDVLAQAPTNTSDLITRSTFAHIPGAEEVLRECIWRSIEIRQGLVDGEVACVWGLIPPTILSNTAYLWLCTTDIIAEHKFLFIRHSQRYIEEALKRYSTIIGEVVGHNPPARRWIRWLGGEFGPTILDRTPFTIRAK
jgi:hypothetical protein